MPEAIVQDRFFINDIENRKDHGEKDNNKQIDIAEFYNFLTNKLNFMITNQEIEDLFLQMTG